MPTTEATLETAPIARWEALTFAGILAIAVVLRLVGLNSSLWYGEVSPLARFIRSPVGEWITASASLKDHMFYLLQAKAAVAVFGEGAWSLRLPSFIFGLASIGVLWVMGRDAIGRTPALLAAFLLAIAYHHVWFSQDARGFTELLFWTSAATVLFVRGLRRPGWVVWVVYGLCVAAGMYTNLSAGYFFATHFIVYAVAVLSCRSPGSDGTRLSYPGLRDLRAISGLAFGGVLSVVLYLPVIIDALPGPGKSLPKVTTTFMDEWFNPLRMAREIVFSLGNLGVLSPLVLASALVVIAVGAAAIFRKSPLLAAIYALHVPLALGLMLMFSVIIWPRYFFVDIGFIVLCIATGAYDLSERAGRYLQRHGTRPVAAKALFVTAVIALSVVSVALLARNYAYPKQDFAGAVALIERERMPGDVATSIGLADVPIHRYFAPTWPVVESADQLHALLNSANSVWIVTAFPGVAKQRNGDVIALVNRDFDLVAKLPGTLGDGTVRVYRSAMRATGIPHDKGNERPSAQ